MSNNILVSMPWRRLVKVGKPFWVSNRSKQGYAHLLLVLVLLTAKAYVAVFVNQTAGHFSTAIEQKSYADFHLYLVLSGVGILLTVPIDVFYGMFRTRLALVWRKWLSGYFIDKYFDLRLGLRVEGLHDVDNPEQRMTQDADSFCNSSVGLFISVLDATISVATFITVLWVISPTLSYTVMIYSTLGLLIVAQIGKQLIPLSFQQMKTEADLRSSLKDAREELRKKGTADGREDEIDGGEIVKAVESRGRLKDVIDTLMSIMFVNRNIQLFTHTFNLAMPLIPAVIIAPSYFAGEIPFGTITQAAMAFTSVFHGATVFIGQFNGLSHYAAITNRLGVMVEEMDDGVSFQERQGDTCPVRLLPRKKRPLRYLLTTNKRLGAKNPRCGENRNKPAALKKDFRDIEPSPVRDLRPGNGNQ
jgi:putative ATP-binding cassette transporter